MKCLNKLTYKNNQINNQINKPNMNTNNTPTGTPEVIEEFLSFNEARKFIRTLNLKSKKEWIKYCNSGNKPNNIPSNPDVYYKKTIEPAKLLIQYEGLENDIINSIESCLEISGKGYLNTKIIYNEITNKIEYTIEDSNYTTINEICLENIKPFYIVDLDEYEIQDLNSEIENRIILDIININK